MGSVVRLRGEERGDLRQHTKTMNTNDNKPDWLQITAQIVNCAVLITTSWLVGLTYRNSTEAIDRFKHVEQLIANESSSLRAAVQNATRGQDLVSSDVVGFGYQAQHHQLGMTNNMALGSYASTFKDNQITVRFRSGKSMFIDVPEGEIIDSGHTYQEILQSIKRAMEQRGETNNNAKTQ